MKTLSQAGHLQFFFFYVILLNMITFFLQEPV